MSETKTHVPEAPLDALNSALAADESYLIDLRHALHQIPELGLDLPQTGSRIKEELEQLDLEITECQSVTGFMAVLRGGKRPTEGKVPTVLLRADMDALPVTERTGLEYASTNGAMHACGHDLHMSGLVGAARALHKVRDELAGDVVFMFQPGEEGHDGAQHMIDENMLEASGQLPDHAYGIHVWAARYPHGFIGTRPGPMMASVDTFHLTIKGRGGHGSAPHETRDPVPVAAEIITQSQVMVAREFNVFDPVVATCGHVEAGNSSNVVPEEASLHFTLRAFSDEARSKLCRRIAELAEGIAAAHGQEADITFDHLYPVTKNDPSEYDFCEATVDDILPGRWALQNDPMAAAEDFSKVIERIPGCFIGVSAVAEGKDHDELQFNHSAFAVFDDSVIVDCSRVLATLAVRRINQ